MATTQTSAKKKTAAKTGARKTASKSADAVALLQADHREVEKYFADFEKARTDKRKKELADKICLALRVHTQIEEEIFYPVSREYLNDEDIVDEAVVEHASAKDLIEQIEAMTPGEELYDAKVKVLGELVEHHVEEEEKEYFPQVKKTEMDLNSTGEQMAARKAELMTELAGPNIH